MVAQAFDQAPIRWRSSKTWAGANRRSRDPPLPEQLRPFLNGALEVPGDTNRSAGWRGWGGNGWLVE